jgi:hypothetical protein
MVGRRGFLVLARKHTLSPISLATIDIFRLHSSSLYTKHVSVGDDYYRDENVYLDFD